MKSQLKLGTVFGVELGLHYSWFLIAVLIVFSLAAQFHAQDSSWSSLTIWLVALITGVAFFAGLYVHEISHAVVAKMYGIPVHQITLFLLGGVAQIEKDASDAKSEFWIAIVGPITSAILGLALLVLARVTGWNLWSVPARPRIAILVWLGYINLMLGAFNMLPAFPMDGGRVLRALLWWSTGSAERATRYAARLGQWIAFLFIGLGILRFFDGAGLAGLWLAFIGWFLLQASGATLLQNQIGISLRGLAVADLMSDDYGIVAPGMSLEEFVHEKLLRGGHRFYLVAEQSHMLGLITSNEVKHSGPAAWASMRVDQVMVPADKVFRAWPEMSVADSLEMMVSRDVHQLPVISGGRIAGVISRAHILQQLRLRMDLGRLDINSSMEEE